MMASWIAQHMHQEPALTTEEQLELVRQELDALERRVAFIEATLAAIRADEDEEGAGA